MSQPIPPIIVIGMHRSGTSLLSRALQRAGLFMGVGRTPNAEAAFTKALNTWLFHQASATWDRPEAMDELLADDKLRPWLLDYMGGITRGPASMRFLGPGRWLRYRSLHRVREPWGWKDPRNTYTLPLWLEIFPDARILHIVRHGVDVAESLRIRRNVVVASKTARYKRLRPLYVNSPFAPKRRGFGPQVRCGALEGGFTLWEAYVARGREHTINRGHRALELSYETLLYEPRHELERVLAFCGLKRASAVAAKVGADINPSRACAYRGAPELAAFARSMQPRLARLGYGNIDDKS